MHAGFFAPCSICDVIKPRLRPYPRSSLRSRTIKKFRNVTKPRRVCVRRRKEISIIFSGDMRGGENTARLANVRHACAAASRSLFPPGIQRSDSRRSVCRRRTQKPRCRSSGGCSLSKNLVEFRCRSGERKSNHFLRRHVRRRKYFSACKRAPCVRCSEPQSFSAGNPAKRFSAERVPQAHAKTPLPKQRGLLICGCSAGAQTMRLSRT